MGALEKEKIEYADQLRAHKRDGEDDVEWIPSGIMRRFMAMFIDSIILSSLNLIIQKGIMLIIGVPDFTSLISGQNQLDVAEISQKTMTFFSVVLVSSTLVGFFYAYIFMKKWSATPGKKILGLKVIRLNDNKGWGMWSVFVREVFGKSLSYFVFAFGFIWAFFDKKKQSWHDKLADSVVIRVER